MDERKSLYFACAIVLLTAFAFQGTRGLWEPDEGTFGAVAGEMLDRGDVLMPTLHGEPYPEKPPLMYWGMIAGMKLLGRNEWGQRLFYGFCFAACAALTGLLAASMWSRREGILAGMIYGTMAVPLVGGQIARPDAPLALGVSLALYCFWKSVSSERPTLWKMLMCVSFGIAFLGKGPAAFVFAAPLFVYLVAQKKAFRYFVTSWAVVGAALFLAVGLGWYYYMVKTDSRMLAYFWDNQVHGRLVSGKYHRNPKLTDAVLIYGPVLLLGPLPWAFFWPGWIKTFAPAVTTRKWWAELRNRPRALLVASWVIVPTVVLSVASSKLPLYLLPVFPAFALATARGWTLLAPEPARDSRMRTAAACFCVLLISAKGVFAYVPSDKDSRRFWNDMQAKIPANTRQLIAINQDLNGLGFYSKLDIVGVTTHRELYPAFVPCIRLEEELQQIATNKTPCVFISSTKKAPLNKMISDTLTKQGISVQEVAMPFKRRLLICTAAPAAPPASPAGAAANAREN